MAYSDEVLADSPVGYWRLGETSGTTANDSSGNGYNGTHTNVTVNQTSLLAADSNPSALYVRASSSRTSMGDNAAFTPGSTWTVEALIKLASYSGGQFHFIVSKGHASHYEWEFLVDSSQKLQFTLYSSLDAVELYRATGVTTINVGSVYHVVGVYESGVSARVYVNNVLDGTDNTGSGTVQNGAAELVIGTRNTFESHYFDGWIDEVAIYATALSAARIQAHYEASTAASASASVTGQAITSALGTVDFTGIDIFVPVTGQLLNASVEQVGFSISQNIDVSGQAITSALGSVDAQISVAVTGEAIVSSVGSVSFLIDQNIPVTGQAITANVGSVVIHNDLAESVSGNAITSGVGAVGFGPDVYTLKLVAVADELVCTDTSSASRRIASTAEASIGIEDTHSVSLTYVLVVSDGLGIDTEAEPARRIPVSVSDAVGVSPVLASSSTYLVSVVDRVLFVAPVRVGSVAGTTGTIGAEDTDTNEAWVVNLNTNAVSKYNEFVFGSMAEFAGKTYAANENKLYSLDGSDACARSMTAGKLDLDDGYFARLPYVYAAVDGSGFLSIKIVLDTDTEYTYAKEIINVFPDLLRVPLGRGLRSRYWEIELHHRDSEPIEVEHLELPFQFTNRRIG